LSLRAFDFGATSRKGTRLLPHPPKFWVWRCRFVLRLPTVVEMSRDEIVEWLGPTIQRYLGLPEG
jgi:hypothetical protein